MTGDRNKRFDEQRELGSDGDLPVNHSGCPIPESDDITPPSLEVCKRDAPSEESGYADEQDNGSQRNTVEQVGGDSRNKVLATISQQLEAVRLTVIALGERVQSLTQQQEFLQNGVRDLRNRVTDAAKSLSEPRVRELFMRLLLLYDLVSPKPAGSSEDVASLCELIATQIEQFFEVNGFKRVPTDGSVFDSRLHKPIQVESVQDPSLDGRVLRTFQNGFQSSQAVLRPAAVVIGRASSDPAVQEKTGYESRNATANHAPVEVQSQVNDEERSGK